MSQRCNGGVRGGGGEECATFFGRHLHARSLPPSPACLPLLFTCQLTSSGGCRGGSDQGAPATWLVQLGGWGHYWLLWLMDYQSELELLIAGIDPSRGVSSSSGVSFWQLSSVGETGLHNKENSSGVSEILLQLSPQCSLTFASIILSTSPFTTTVNASSAATPPEPAPTAGGPYSSVQRC